MTARGQIKRFEGLRRLMYVDTKGKWTIGYGHNLSDRRISKAAAEVIFTDDIAEARKDVDVLLPGVLCKLNKPRQAVFLSMAFQLGRTSMRGFKRMLIAARGGYHELVAHEMLDSKWARDDTPERAGELAKQMHTGRWAQR